MKSPWEETAASLVLSKYVVRKKDRQNVKKTLDSNKALCCVLLETQERLCDLFDTSKSEFYLEISNSSKTKKEPVKLVVRINTSLLEQEALSGLNKIEVWIDSYEASVFNRISFDVSTFD